MRYFKSLGLIGLLMLGTSVNSFAQRTAGDQPKPVVKEWTFLVFLNGNNNLDSYGAKNINQMEAVGSNADINIVVQWASLQNGKTQRVYVQKDSNPNQVTSPIVEDMGARVDMGDYRTLVEFVRWASVKYPAKHYFIDLWDHGSGWHLQNLLLGKAGLSSDPSYSVTDISFDDKTGNKITTKQLGTALQEISQIIGHKVDILASDACLMAMAELGSEMKDSVQVMAGSEEVEPAAGWPYDKFFARWASNSRATANEVATYLTQEYLKSYSAGGSNGRSEVTFSAVDLSKMDRVESAIRTLGAQIRALNAADQSRVAQAAQDSISFAYSDYVDLGDFLVQLKKQNIQALNLQSMNDVRASLEDFVFVNGVSSKYQNAKGLAIWLPTSKYTYSNYISRYKELVFDRITQWSDAITAYVNAGSSGDSLPL
jgi:hypothetical protein